MTTQPEQTPELEPVTEHTWRHVTAQAGAETARVLKKIHDHLFPNDTTDENTEEVHL